MDLLFPLLVAVCFFPLSHYPFVYQLRAQITPGCFVVFVFALTLYYHLTDFHEVYECVESTLHCFSLFQVVRHCVDELLRLTLRFHNLLFLGV